MIAQDLNENKFDDILQGLTFQIYWYLLLYKEAGIRELQRELKLSSPNLVSHHLKKLINSGLVKQDTESNKYFIIYEVRRGILTLFIRLGRHFVPINIFLIAFFLSMLGSYLILFLVPRQKFIPEDLFFLSIASVGIIFLLYMTQKIIRLKPI